MFDLNSVSELEQSTLNLVHPETGALIGASIVLAGANHSKRKQVEFNRARVLRARVAKKGRFEMPDPQEVEEYEIDRFVACTLSWSGLARDGKAIECTATEVRALYESTGWIRAQVFTFLEDAANFLQSSKQT